MFGLVSRKALLVGFGSAAAAAAGASGAVACTEETGETARLARWRKGWATRYGTTPSFHKFEPNPYLRRHYAEAFGPADGGSAVLVPLCGKTVDMAWLSGKGHAVVGVEGVATAIEQFSQESAPMRQSGDDPRLWLSSGSDTMRIAIVEGDFLQMGHGRAMSNVLCELTGTCQRKEPFDGIWDRAALVAIDPEDRDEYAATQVKLLKPGGRMLLSTLSYDQSKMKGPPHSVDEATVRTLYEQKGMSVKLLGSEPASGIGPGNGKFSVLDRMDELQFLLTKDK
jgi:thiopurine S-methyltransferase